MKNLRLTSEQAQAHQARVGHTGPTPRPGRSQLAVGKPLRPNKRPSGYIRILLAEIKTAKLPIPDTEYRFDALHGRRWRFDLAFVWSKIAIEVDGGVYTGGRHIRGMGFEADCEKLNEGLIQGWRILRYSTGQVRKGLPILDLKRLLAEALARPRT